MATVRIRPTNVERSVLSEVASEGVLVNLTQDGTLNAGPWSLVPGPALELE